MAAPERLKSKQNRTGHLFQEVRHQRRDGPTVLMADVDTMAGLHSQDIPAVDGA
jgi:hypothetical protein